MGIRAAPVRRLTVAVLLALGGSGASPAHAAEPPAEVARQLSKRAHEAYRDGKYQEALDLLGAAYRLDPRPVLVYNMGRALEHLDVRAAVREYRRCLDQPGCPDAAGERVRALEEQLRAEDLRTASATPAPTRVEAPPPPPVPPPVSDDGAPSPWPWIVAGAGLAGVAAGITLGAVASARHDDARGEPSAGAARDLAEQADDLALGTNIALVAGGAVLLAGGVWAVIDLSTRQSPARGGIVLRATASSVSILTRF